MKIGILTGGGDCPGLNPAIRGFVLQALDYGDEVWGIRKGWLGLLQDLVEPAPLNIERVEEIVSWGGTILGSSRTNPYEPEEDKDRNLATIRARVSQHGFGAIAAIGGEDTLGVASKLYADGINTVGVPKTMDNDLNDTDYTFGFFSAVECDVDAVDRLRDTMKSHNRIGVLEVMGRHAGYVAQYVGVAGGADFVLLPETGYDLDKMCAHLKRVHARKGYAIVVASEGVKVPELEARKKSKVDAFGHANLGGGEISNYFAEIIQKITGIETRPAVTGHIQRGGRPVAFDRVLGSRVGMLAARCVHEGRFGVMAALHGTRVEPVPLAAAAERARKLLPAEYEEYYPLYNK